MRLRFTRRAATQVDKALGYIQIRSPQGADRVSERVGAIVAILQLHPYSGHPTSRRGVLRALVVPYPYLIDYRVTGDEIVIQRFRHTSRRPVS